MEPCRRHTTDLRTALAVLLAVLATGCTPKRVVQGQVETADPPQQERAATTVPDRRGETAPQTDTVPVREPEQVPVAGLDLPGPEPRGRSGTAPVRRTAAEVNLGVKAATLAREQLGKPYQWGATGPDRFDCSGLVWHVYGQLGVQIPRVSREQARSGREIVRSELQLGDLVFFATEGQTVNHVGIYVGESDFVHAPRRYQPVKTDSLNNSWWRRRYKGARRVP
ncbi:MAG: C40 family peptidase [bacterium]|nr:C40 family peptidase [bacterium]